MIAVRPDLQGGGRGAALRRYAEDDLRQRNQRLLIVRTSGTSQYAATRAFYRGLDDEEQSRVPDSRHRCRHEHAAARRQRDAGLDGGPGRTVGGDSAIQRDWPNPGSQLFGQVTSRTHRAGRYASHRLDVSTRLTERGATTGGKRAGRRVRRSTAPCRMTASCTSLGSTRWPGSTSARSLRSAAGRVASSCTASRPRPRPRRCAPHWHYPRLRPPDDPRLARQGRTDHRVLGHLPRRRSRRRLLKHGADPATQLTGVAGVPTTGVTAVVLNVTACSRRRAGASPPTRTA